jgi:hypothetical protein
MSDATVRALQYTLNRYASIAGFATIGTDGIMGPNTANAILKSFSWIVQADPSATDTAAGLTEALVNDDGSYNYDQMVSSAYGLNLYLTQEADALRVKASQMVATSSGGGGGGSLPIVSAPAPKTGVNVGANLYAQLAHLPTWAKIAGGAVVAMLGFAAWQHNKARHGNLKGFLGLGKPARRRSRRYA